jgi:molybdopterin synthase sulfur carrier subunit
MIKIIFFARLRELMGIEQLDYALASEEQTSVDNILHTLATEYPSLSDYIAQGHLVMIAVNQQTADFSKILKPGDELAFFPPVTGG